MVLSMCLLLIPITIRCINAIIFLLNTLQIFEYFLLRKQIHKKMLMYDAKI